MPVTLDTDSEQIKVGDKVLLTSKEFGKPNPNLAILEVTSKWIPNRVLEGEKVYGTESEEHPAVWHLVSEKKKYNIGGRVYGIALPKRDWVECKTPREIRDAFHARK